MSNPELGPSSPLVTPLYPTAVYTLPDLDALDAIADGKVPGYIYARDAHPNADSLATKLVAIEDGTWGIVCGSGMAALSAVFAGLLSSGDTVVASNRLYGRTTQLLRSHLVRFGVKTVSVDANDLNATRTAVAEHKPKLLFVETMSNPLCRTPDVPALAEMAHSAGCRLVVDNTFATPVVCRPLSLGADIAMESLTKMIGGHSDVTLGFLAAKDPAIRQPIKEAVTVWGLSACPFACWQVERGLDTLDLRMRAAMANAAATADWLASQPNVSRVVYPGRPDHPDHLLAKRLYPAGFGNMLCFELPGGREAVNRFMRAAPEIPFSPSLGHTATTISYPAGTSHRYDSPADRQGQGITEGLIRVSVGCEAFEQLQRAITKGLRAS